MVQIVMYLIPYKYVLDMVCLKPLRKTLISVTRLGFKPSTSHHAICQNETFHVPQQITKTSLSTRETSAIRKKGGDYEKTWIC